MNARDNDGRAERATERERWSGLYYEVVGQRNRFPHPVVFIHGGGGTGAKCRATPDGRPGWADVLGHRGFESWVKRRRTTRPVHFRGHRRGVRRRSRTALHVQRCLHSCSEDRREYADPMEAIDVQGGGREISFARGSGRVGAAPGSHGLHGNAHFLTAERNTMQGSTWLRIQLWSVARLQKRGLWAFTANGGGALWAATERGPA